MTATDISGAAQVLRWFHSPMITQLLKLFEQSSDGGIAALKSLGNVFPPIIRKRNCASSALPSRTRLPRRWLRTSDRVHAIASCSLYSALREKKAIRALAATFRQPIEKWFFVVTFPVNAVSDRRYIIAALQCYHVGSKVIVLIYKRSVAG